MQDTAANAQLAGDLLSLSFNWENVQCAAHRLQLVINEGMQMPTFTPAIGAARNLVGQFKHSALATAQWKLS